MAALWDCHAHILDPALAPDLADVLCAAYAANVQHIVCVPETVTQSAQMLAFSPPTADGPRLLRCAGIHPVQAHSESVADVITLIRTHHERIAAIGECGLDFSPHVLAHGEPAALKQAQTAAFDAQIAVAVELGLPLNVHSRSAGHYAIEALRAAGARAVLHAFDGKAAYAERAARDGYFFSVPPSIERSPQFQELVRRLPLESLLLESDAPALPPRPGERNVPANVALSCAAVARIKGVAEDVVAATTSASATRLFTRATP